MKTNCSRFSFVMLSVALAAAPFASGCIGGVCGVDADPELEPGNNASADEAPGHEHAEPCGEHAEDAEHVEPVTNNTTSFSAVRCPHGNIWCMCTICNLPVDQHD